MCVVRCAWYSSTRDELRSRRAEHVTIPRTTYQRTILSGAPDSLRFGGCWPGAAILSSASARGCSSAGRAPGSHPGGQGFEPPQLHCVYFTTAGARTGAAPGRPGGRIANAAPAARSARIALPTNAADQVLNRSYSIADRPPAMIEATPFAEYTTP